MAHVYFRHRVVDTAPQEAIPPNLPTRPSSLNPTGQLVQVKLNHFPVSKLPDKPVYQYDVGPT